MMELRREVREAHAAARAERHTAPGAAPGAASRSVAAPVLEVSDLIVSFDMYDPAAPFFSAGRVERRALDGLSLTVFAGEVVAVVGASGSGKTILADVLLGMVEPNARVTGRVSFQGRPCSIGALAALAGRGISLVPQGTGALDPLARVKDQLAGRHGRGREGRAAAKRRRERAEALLAGYGFGPRELALYPHQLSGGMVRRVLIACALADDPALVVADEPTPGLEPELARRALADLRAFADGGGAVLLITHDIELALGVSDRIAVVRDGSVVEEAPVAAFRDPDLLTDPYARALWHAMPEHGFAAAGAGEGDVTAAGEADGGAADDAVGAIEGDAGARLGGGGGHGA